jgi:small subunit ribosomal protein S7
MSRRRRVIHKEEKIDARYGSPLVARLIGRSMKSGQRQLAERVAYEAIEESRQGSEAVDPLEALNKAVENVRPRLETKSRRVGGATYQGSDGSRPGRGQALALRWIVTFAQNRKGSFRKALANELRKPQLGQGNAVKKRDDTHKMAQANRAFAHFRF